MNNIKIINGSFYFNEKFVLQDISISCDFQIKNAKIYNDLIYAYNDENIYLIENNKIKLIYPLKNISNISLYNNYLYVLADKIYKFNKDTFELLCLSCNEIQENKIWNNFNIYKNNIFVSYENYIYKFDYDLICHLSIRGNSYIIFNDKIYVLNFENNETYLIIYDLYFHEMQKYLIENTKTKIKNIFSDKTFFFNDEIVYYGDDNKKISNVKITDDSNVLIKNNMIYILNNNIIYIYDISLNLLSSTIIKDKLEKINQITNYLIVYNKNKIIFYSIYDNYSLHFEYEYLIKRDLIELENIMIDNNNIYIVKNNEITKIEVNKKNIFETNKNISVNSINVNNKLMFGKDCYIKNRNNSILINKNIYSNELFTNAITTNTIVLNNLNIESTGTKFLILDNNSGQNIFNLNVGFTNYTKNSFIAPICDNIENYEIGRPCYIGNNNYIFEDGKFILSLEPGICAVSSKGINTCYLGIITDIIKAGTTKEINNRNVNFENDCVEFSTYGCYFYKINSKNTPEDKKISVKSFKIGNIVTCDGLILNSDTIALTKSLVQNIIGTVYCIIDDEYVGIIKTF